MKNTKSKGDIVSDIEQYLSEDEKKEIASRVFEEKLRTSFSTAEAERVVTNMAYELAERLVTNNINDQFKEAIEAKLPKIIDELGTYTVFSRGDDYGAFRKEPTLAWKTVDDWVKKNNVVIEDRVREIVAGIDKVALREEISNAIYKAVVEPTI
jgi:hypothetical protein